MMDHVVYLALGSNVGHRLANLKSAITNLPPQMDVKKKSLVYETPPWGYTEQPPFLNQVVMVKTYMEPEDLLGHLKRLETALGREPTFQNGPRVIDIDILFYDDLVLDSPELTIPHPRMHHRAFVLVPLNNIAPDFIHPVLGKPINELLLDVDRLNIHEYKGK
ncbi:MAG: 2-amino-4-hydroxy-6-hydroxymethyldihydropteridine diphosphokinase [Anaerolineales bacterium]|nr:2-amino-4-hydroxy-6-hydroxymethyldihydropteridine diphosphokinase [Anaerolineales bacterium]MCB9109841.1 2-amino-4-hydroxy-6-hydroxymethyldihydropteridine diphosphokinase [Anaerolineales bacterium]